MPVLLLIARLFLASVFFVAGFSKLADRKGSRQSMVDFGLPATLATALGVALPIVELLVALSLLPRPTAWVGSLGAVLLLLAFTAGISYNLARGRKPDCHCFGQLPSRPIGWQTLARNGVLLLVAGFVLWQGRGDPGASMVAWLGALTTPEQIALSLAALACALAGTEGWVLLQMLQQNGRLLVRLESLELSAATGGLASAPAAPSVPTPAYVGLPIGTPAPTFALAGLYGETFTLDGMRAGAVPVVLVFGDPDCGPCSAFLPDVARYQREYAAKATIALVSRGSAAANRAKASEHGLTRVLLEADQNVRGDYLAVGTPSAVLVRADGAIGSAVAQGADQIRSLIAVAVGLPALTPLATTPTALGANGHHNGAKNGHATPGAAANPALRKIGDAAPDITLPDLAGNTVSLSSLRRGKTLLLFWNPTCGFCQRMLDDLKAWEAARPPDAPSLVLVSTGDVAANRAQGLTSPILLEPSFTAGQVFGAQGTPTAVLLDEQGKVASALAVGGPAVLDLAGRVPTP